MGILALSTGFIKRMGRVIGLARGFLVVIIDSYWVRDRILCINECFLSLCARFFLERSVLSICARFLILCGGNCYGERHL